MLAVVTSCTVTPTETVSTPTLIPTSVPSATVTAIPPTNTPIVLTQTSTPTATPTIAPSPTALLLPNARIIYGQDTRIDGLRYDRLKLLDLPSLDRRDLLDPDRFVSVDIGSISTDGRYLAFDDFTNSENYMAFDIYILDLNSDKPKHLQTGMASSGSPIWSNDGTQLAFIGGNGPFSSQALFTINVQTGLVEQLTWKVVPLYGPKWSPDDKSIAYVADDEAGSRNLYVVSLNRKFNPKLLGRCDSYFSWSPDSQTLACSADINGNTDIYLLKAEAGFPAVRLTKDLGEDTDPSWSPDGRYITYAGKTADKYAIYQMRSDGSQQLKLTNNNFDNEFPVWSADGQFIYFVLGNAGNSNGTWDIYCMPKDGANPLVLARGLFYPYFSVADTSK